MRKEKLEELENLIKEVTPVECDKPLDFPEKYDAPFITSIPHFFNINGKVIKRDQLIKGGKAGNAVDVLPIDKDGNVTLVVQPRVFTERKVGVEIPAGYIEPGEDPEVSARREIKEETGLSIGDLTFLTKAYQDEGSSSAILYYYLATNCVQTNEQHLDEDEIIKTFTCTFDELLELFDLGYIQGNSSRLCVELAKKYLKN